MTGNTEPSLLDTISPSARNYCFTLNNYTEEDVLFLSNNLERYKYICWGREVGQNGTSHLQGYVSFGTRKTLRAAKALINDRAHLEVAKGSKNQNREYCKKDGQFEEFGDCSTEQGRRTDLELLAQRLRDGDTVRGIANDFGPDFIRYGRGIREMHFLFDAPKPWATTVLLFYGKAGTGKTYRAFKTEPDLWVYAGSGWFDGYEGQEAALFDDFGGHEFKLTYLLKLLDQYPMRVPIKGSFVQWKPRRIYLTSNHPWIEWYNNVTVEHIEALERRIHIIVKFEDNKNTIREKP